MKKILLLLLYAFLLVPAVSFARDIEETRRDAEAGDPIAQNNLGGMYDKGEGVPQDYAEAVKWFRKAAAQGYASAQNNLGLMYYKGEGVPQNYSDAYVWFSIAAASGDESRTHNRDLAAERLTPEALATAQQRAAKLFEEIEARKAAQN